jgi:hypothetical protein
MGSYTEFRNYFKNIATNNKKIQHLDQAAKKRFFEFSIEEVVLGSVHDLPGEGISMIYSGFVDRFFFSDKTKKKRELMFFIQQKSAVKDWVSLSAAKDNTMICVEEILSKIISDSINDEAPELEQSFNQASKVNIIPNELKIGGSVWVGWQVSIEFTLEFNKCFNINDWL